MKAFIIVLISSISYCQIPPYEFYCDISHTQVKSSVSYESARAVYSYSYIIDSGINNTGWINGFDIDISCSTKHTPQIDTDLRDTCSPRTLPNYNQLLSEFAIPVGLSAPPQSGGCMAGKVTNYETRQDKGGVVSFGFLPDLLHPGNSASGYTIESKYPPGIRDFNVTPNKMHCYGHIPMNGTYWEVVEGDSFSVPKGWGYDEDHWLRGKTIGPVEPNEYTYFNGGGQKPNDVNLFLKYANPIEHSTTLPAGQATFDLIVYYGSTTDPTTFTAELNGQAITSRFSPAPGLAEAEHLELQPGRNTLTLKVDGKNARGSTATDTDRLVFIVQ